MQRKIIGFIVCTLLLITSIPAIGAVSMHPTAKPSITHLTHEVYWVGVEYTFYFTFVDPEGDQWYFMVSWGDGTYSDWQGPYDSGETASITHYWIWIGNYEIKMKVKDVHGNESPWSEPLAVTVIPPNRFFRHMEISGTLKTKPWRGLILSILNFDCATVTKAISENVQLDPFTCHNYKFVALALNVHSYDKETLYIEASMPFAILISY